MRHGVSVHIGDFRAQMQRTLDNITGLLESEGCTWHDIVRTSAICATSIATTMRSTKSAPRFSRRRGSIRCRRQREFRRILCRPELLIEIEAIAMFRTEKTAK